MMEVCAVWLARDFLRTAGRPIDIPPCAHDTTDCPPISEGAHVTTHTRTHTYITFANPHLTCDRCKQPVPRWHNDDRCGCDDTFWNDPCGCERVGVTSVCPSWGPVDGCTCVEPHVPPADA